MKQIYHRITAFVFMFMLSAFVGWIYEVVVGFIIYGKYSDRGVLHLPMCAIYGFGMLVLWIVFRNVRGVIKIFVGSVIITTVVELIASYLLEKVFDLELWNYSHWPLNYEGRISAVSSAVFGLLAVLFLKGIYPLTMKIYSSRAASIFAMCVSALFLFCATWEVCFLIR